MPNDEYIEAFCPLNTQQQNSNLNGGIKAAPKRHCNRNKIANFDSKIDYDSYLRKFRLDFEKKWKCSLKSPSTGLVGFTEIGTLGKGSFGNVQLVKNNTTGEIYATKVLSKRKLISASQVTAVFNEKRVLYSIRFPNHTNLEFSRKDDKFLYLGMTLAGGGELFLYHRKLGHFSEKQACFYAAQIFLALEYLHNLNLIYRDLKPENLCLDFNGYIKVTDYGFTKHVPDRTLTLCGTPEYLAPEVIKMKPYGTSADWWAFGILLYEFVAGKSPFSLYASDPMKMYGKICDGDYKMPSKFSNILKNLISRLLQPNLSKRIGVCNNGNGDIKRHCWFRKVDWYAILNQTVKPPYVPTTKKLGGVFRDFQKNSPSKNSEKVERSDVFDSF